MKKSKILIILNLLVFSNILYAQSISNTYSVGDIPTNNTSYSSTCNGPVTPLSVTLPAGGPWNITSIDVVYNMTAASGAWKSEQRSKIYCQNTSIGEASYASGIGSSAGIQSYNRTGLTIANGSYAGGTVLTFEMQAYRTWTGGGTCNTTYNKVDNNTWTITVNYSAPPTCPDPSILTAAGITGTTANLGWLENGSATIWDIELGAMGFSPTGTPSQNNVTANPYSYTGLTSATSYDYYVRSDCGGGDESNWVGPFNFSTAITCPSPSSLTATSITTNSANLGWVENGSSTTWDIELGLNGFVPTGTPTQTGVNSNPYVYTGLIPNTIYDYYVRSDCGSGDYSTWSGPFTFTTNLLVGQVYLASTGGTSSGVYNTMKLAFDAINAGTHTGTITITVGNTNGQTITETSEASLNKSGSGGASYTSVSIYPGASNIKITSNIAGACCLASGTIKLNEANNVTIDGRQGGIGTSVDLTIENSNTGSWGVALILVNASNNNIKYCMLKSSNSSTSGGNGTLSFKDNNAAGGDPGCDNNIVEFCHFNKAGSTMPLTAIASDGNVIVGELHNDNIIRNCSIYNFQRYGIWLSGGGSDGGNRDWIIENNAIYQTELFSSMSYDQVGICIGDDFSSSNGELGTFIINNNNIGGNGSGGDWTCTSNSSRRVAGIAINSLTTAYSTISNNVISNFDISTTNTATDYGLYTGIVVSNGKVNIRKNTIGDLTQSDNIKIKRSNTTNGGMVSGIQVNSNSDLENIINYNTVSGIALISGSSNFFNFYGIKNSSATTYPKDSVYANNISYLKSTKANYCYGIYGQGFISKNRIRDIDFVGAASFSELKGIRWGGGEITSSDSRGVENNEIILGLNKSGASIGGNDLITGIQITRGDADVYYNSVLIQGVGTNSDNSYAIELPNTGTVNFYNNLLYNERSGGTGKHYSVYKTGLGVAFSSSNNAYVIGTTMNNLVGNWSGVDKATLNDWQSASGEINSIASTSALQPTSTIFPLLSQDSLDVPDPTWLQAGIPTVPTTDIKGILRAAIPTIGAYEKSIILSVDLIDFNISCEDNQVQLKWMTSTEINNDYFTIERSNDGMNFEETVKIKGVGNSNTKSSYGYIDDIPLSGVTYYRIKQTDYDGKYEYFKVQATNCYSNNEINIYPNPFVNFIEIHFENATETNYNIDFVNYLGQVVFSEKVLKNSTNFRLEIGDKISKGTYYMQVYNDQEKRFTQKIIKL